MDKISVLIVDDHAVVRQGLRSLLELQEELEVVGEATNGVEAVDQARQLVTISKQQAPLLAVPKERAC